MVAIRKPELRVTVSSGFMQLGKNLTIFEQNSKRLPTDLTYPYILRHQSKKKYIYIKTSLKLKNQKRTTGGREGGKKKNIKMYNYLDLKYLN